jgi:hypothetical protein
MSEKREAYVEKLKTQLDELNSDLDELEAKTRNARREVKEKFERQINELRQKAGTARQRLCKIQEAQEGAWDNLKGGADAAWKALKEGFANAKLEFKRVYREGLEEQQEHQD